MRTELEIQKYIKLIEHKLLDMQARLSVLDLDSQSLTLMDSILPIVDKLGCCVPKYCLPGPCDEGTISFILPELGCDNPEG